MTKPDFLIAAERIAARHGTTAQEVLDHDREAVLKSNCPGPDCLEPYELEAIERGSKLDPIQLAHIAACMSCAALVEIRKTKHPAD